MIFKLEKVKVNHKDVYIFRGSHNIVRL